MNPGCEPGSHSGCEPSSDPNAPPALPVVCGIIWRDNRFLGACRPPGRMHAGRWEFPGGKVEAGETPVQALIRELDEELSLQVRKPVFWRSVRHAYPELTVELFFFHVRDFDGEPTPNDGQTLRWLAVDEALNLPFLEPDRPLLEALARAPGRQP